MHRRLACCAAHAAHTRRVFTCPVHQNRTKFATRSRVFSRKFARFRIHYSKNFGAKCITDSAQSFCDVIIVAQLTQRTPAEFCVRGRQNSHKICNTSPRFREILLDFERPNRKVSASNATLTQLKAVPTSRVFYSARGRCRPTSVSVAHRNRTKFASESRVFSHKFPRIRTRKSKNLGAKRSAHSAESYADIMRVAQRT